jgi:hypothetical protein
VVGEEFLGYAKLGVGSRGVREWSEESNTGVVLVAAGTRRRRRLLVIEHGMEKSSGARERRNRRLSSSSTRAGQRHEIAIANEWWRNGEEAMLASWKRNELWFFPWSRQGYGWAARRTWMSRGRWWSSADSVGARWQAVAEPPWDCRTRVGARWPGHAITRRRVADNWARLYFVFSKLFNHSNFEI